MNKLYETLSCVAAFLSIIIFSATYCCTDIHARRIKLDIKGLSEKSKGMDPQQEAVLNPDSVIFSGYDKQNASDYESVFITNKTDVNISGLEIKIEYRDMNGRMLHSRSVKLNAAVPAGETRKVDFRSWDRQHSFHFHKSATPKKQSVPYSVAISPLRFTTFAEQESLVSHD